MVESAEKIEVVARGSEGHRDLGEMPSGDAVVMVSKGEYDEGGGGNMASEESEEIHSSPKSNGTSQELDAMTLQTFITTLAILWA